MRIPGFPTDGHCARPGGGFPIAVDLVSELDLAGVVRHEYPLDRYADAFAALGAMPTAGVVVAGYDAIKVVIRSDPGEPGPAGRPGVSRG